MDLRPEVPRQCPVQVNPSSPRRFFVVFYGSVEPFVTDQDYPKHFIHLEQLDFIKFVDFV